MINFPTHLSKKLKYCRILWWDRQRRAIPIHRIKVEYVLNRPLDIRHPVHHADGDPLNNRNNNLVVCEDRKYHNLLHTRMRAKKFCGDLKKRICKICGEYDFVENLYVDDSRWVSHYHKKCKSAYDQMGRHRRKCEREV